MGALFSHLAPLRARAERISFGRRPGRQYAGRGAAPLAVRRHRCCRLLGARASARCVVAAGYLLIASRRAWAARPQLVAAAAAAGVRVLAPPLAAIDAAARRAHRQPPSKASPPTVSVVEDARRRGHACTSTTASRKAAARRCSPMRARRVLPLLLHPAPRRALFLGLGTRASSPSRRPLDPAAERRRGRAAARGHRRLRHLFARAQRAPDSANVLQ